MKINKSVIAMIALPLFVGACSKSSFKITEQLTKDVENGVACTNFHEKINATLTQALLDEERLPTSDDLRRSLREKLPASSDKLIERVLQTYAVLTEETKTSLGANSNQEMISALMGLEIGDQTTPEKKALKVRLQKTLASVQAEAKQAGLDCVPPTPEEEETAPVTEEPETLPKENPAAAKLSPPVQGAVRVLATAYQSCQAVRVPAMTASTESIHAKGIKVTGTHPNGVGLKREVGDLALLQKTHYYVREGIENDSSCFNVPKSPLIYDYGGKPYSTTSDTSSLNLFKNAGTGTSVLGIDCSGYIFSALAVSGLRLSPGKKLKAFQVNGVNARMYMDPANNGLSCLAPVASKRGSSLADGDILASTGHIVMIDRVGTDPFGLSRFRSAADCRADNISYKNFDFDILHSAPIKNGIGINRSRASYYLGETSGMRSAMIEYAVAACKAEFGQSSTVKPSSARLVRHKMTAECKDKQVPLERESCVRSCVASL